MKFNLNNEMCAIKLRYNRTTNKLFKNTYELMSRVKIRVKSALKSCSEIRTKKMLRGFVFILFNLKKNWQVNIKSFATSPKIILFPTIEIPIFDGK